MLDGEALGASVLMMPLVGFLPAQDPQDARHRRARRRAAGDRRFRLPLPRRRRTARRRRRRSRSAATGWSTAWRCRAGWTRPARCSSASARTARLDHQGLMAEEIDVLGARPGRAATRRASPTSRRSSRR
ncbi:MAG: hypothetical protein MZW92_35025 [Comamonadaceae bacterium]|nr:hypothetical protein [Comamonadaceae bacterium]